MSVYLRQNGPARSQFRSPRRARPTGLVVVHTAESVMDSVGPDTGAEQVAAFIRGRRDPGSYHDLVDSDSSIQLVRYEDEAYQDGTGSNPYALSLSFALKASDWPRLSAKKTDAFLTQGARALARQQAWLLANRYPVTPLRRVSKADSTRGMAGFISHGERDPGRRTDPGRAFPWSRFFSIAADLATPTSEEGDMGAYLFRDDRNGNVYLREGGDTIHLSGPGADAYIRAGFKVVGDLPPGDVDQLLAAAKQ